MILGNICTRGCRFCAVTKGKPQFLNPQEPRNVGLVVKELSLAHIVVTSVNRDDLPDGGSVQFAQTVWWIKELNPGIRVEILIPDFKGNHQALETVVRSGIDILNHNLETVPRLYKKVRPGAIYERSLNVLKGAKEVKGEVLTKSGLMLGVGETRDEVVTTFRTFVASTATSSRWGSTSSLPENCSQWSGTYRRMNLKDSSWKLFDWAFVHVESGPLVRSSYHAWSHVPQATPPLT